MFKKVLGLIILITGVTLLLSNFDIVSFDNVSGIIFSLGVMVVGLTGLFEKKRFDFFLVVITILGFLFFLSNVGLLEEEIIELILGPVVVIAIGFTLLFSTKKKITDKPVTSYVALFSGVEDKNISSEYISSEITAIFGGAEIDYRKIKIKDKVGYVDVTAAFGGVTIIVPEDVKVIVKGLPIFGGAENKTIMNNESKKELIVTYTAIFGGVEIKN